MNISLYTDKDKTGSTYLMASDLAKVLNKLGHTTKIGSRLIKEDLGRPDVLLNFIPKDSIKILNIRRYLYYGKAWTIFSPGLSAFNDPQIGYMLLTGAYVPIVVHSPTIYEALRVKAKKLLSPSFQKILSKNLIHIPYGVLDIYTHKNKPHSAESTYITPFTRCVETHKKYSDHRNLTIKTNTFLKNNGFDSITKLYYASPELSHIESVSTDGYEIHPILNNRCDYATMLNTIGHSISLSDNESFGLYYIELLLSGVIVIFADYPWVRKLLPNYKFIVPKKDIPLVALAIRRDYSKHYQYIINQVIPELKMKYTLDIFANKLLQCVGTNND